jgi:uncharacterized protein
MRPGFHLLPGLLLALLLAPVSGCAGTATSWVELRGERYVVEVADDPASRARGLMFRDALPPGHGMLFIHDIEEPQAFWMKNTRIALDILYFDRRLRLVSLSAQVPPCDRGDRCPVYPSVQPALYTLELNAGEAGRLGVQAGDELVLSPTLAQDR